MSHVSAQTCITGCVQMFSHFRVRMGGSGAPEKLLVIQTVRNHLPRWGSQRGRQWGRCDSLLAEASRPKQGRYHDSRAVFHASCSKFFGWSVARPRWQRRRPQDNWFRHQCFQWRRLKLVDVLSLPPRAYLGRLRVTFFIASTITFHLMTSKPSLPEGNWQWVEWGCRSWFHQWKLRWDPFVGETVWARAPSMEGLGIPAWTPARKQKDTLFSCNSQGIIN